MSISKRIAFLVLAAVALAMALSAGAVFLLGQQLSLPGSSAWQLYTALALAQGVPCAGLLLMLAKLRPHALGPQVQLVRQLTAAGEGRYEHCVQPEALEWAEPFRAANVMVARLIQRREARDKQLSSLREEVDTDSLTGLASRAQFMQTLLAALNLNGVAPNSALRGVVAIIRVHDLVGVNQRMGRERGDELLASIAMLLRMHLIRLGAADALLARLNGADFAVVASSVQALALDDWLEDLGRGFADLHHNAVADRPHVAWLGASTFTRGEAISDVLSRTDAMVQACESQKAVFRLTSAGESEQAIPTGQWRGHIERALDTGLISLAYFPVLSPDGSVLHREAVIRLALPDGTLMTGAKVVPPAMRTGRIMDLDLRVIELALVELRAHPEAPDAAVNVSPQSLARPLFLERLQVLLDAAGAAASRLWIEVDESVLNDDHGELSALAKMLSASQSRLGIDHFSASWTQAFDLPARGISFVKLDASLCVSVAALSARRDFPKALRGLLGTQPCLVIATGLRQMGDVSTVWASNFDAATGPALTRQLVESAAVQRQAVERV
jgi:EAL domain-containing protein (putative c-di-GMP-specific phosphodiesterase class I)/GGDEF domain-containing protein